MKIVRVTACALLLASQPIVFAQAPGGASAVAGSQTAPPLATSLTRLGALLATVPASPDSLAFAQFRVKTTLTRLQQLSANWPAESPADYRANLDASTNAFERALAAGTQAQLTAFLAALADDLEVKLEHCTRSGGKLGGSVVVSVRTVDGDHESRNWQVFYVPKVFEAAGGITPDRFPALSSPTRETLVPGRYVMWVRDSNNRTSEKVTVKVGEGRKDLPLDLTVPAGAPR